MIGQLLLSLSAKFGTPGTLVAGPGAKAPKRAHMERARYEVILEREAQGGYSVVIPAFPHGHTQGETVDEALSNAREVLELEIEYAKRSTRGTRDGG